MIYIVAEMISSEIMTWFETFSKGVRFEIIIWERLECIKSYTDLRLKSLSNGVEADSNWVNFAIILSSNLNDLKTGWAPKSWRVKFKLSNSWNFA